MEPGRRAQMRVARLAATFVCGLMLVCASAAAAIGPPTNVTAPPSPGQAENWTFTWGPPADAPATGNDVAYQGGVGGAVGDLPAGSVTVPLTEGSHTFQVRAVETAEGVVVPGSESDFVRRTVVVDRTAPAITASISPARPNGLNGWYTSATMRWSCSDGGRGSGIASCPSPEVLNAERAARHQNDPARTIQRPDLAFTRTAVDRVGLTASRTAGPIAFDALAPTAGQPKLPGTDARLAAEPVFTWSRAGNDTSGVDRYEVWVEEPLRVPRVVAGVRHTGRGEYSSARTTGIPLVTLMKVTWYVRSIDRAGNARDSSKRSFTIDPTVPAAPAIVAGPAGPTNVAAPAFEWRGAGDTTFRWDVTVVRDEDTEVVQSGSGAAAGAALAPLPDGEYVFRVTQVSPVGVVSEDATRSFEVDTAAPPPPAITGRPTAASPAYSWTTEPGAFSRWSVAGAGGAAVRPPTDTPGTSAGVGDLPGGAYTFRVQQVDPAGNASAPASEPFVVAAPAAPVVAPAARAKVVLPRRNAKRLRPAAGRTVATRRPLLGWKGGPRAMLYNVQVFRVVRRPAGRSAVVRKVHSAFPRSRTLRMPSHRMAPGSCYIWRVWPFVGKSFSRRPLGISHFCVASRARLKAVARARIAARAKAARAKAARTR